MSRKLFLTVAGAIAVAIGLFALLAPEILLEQAKQATANDAAIVMARTVGVLLVFAGALGLLVRNHPDSETLRAVLGGNLLLQLMILPIDPWAYQAGVFHSLASFVPNTIIHVLLASGFAYFWFTCRTSQAIGPSSRAPWRN